jgi:hypothetical protein
LGAAKERLTGERIEELYPDLLAMLAEHPGIGVLIVRSAQHGLLCMGAHGVNHLDEDRIDGTDPLAVYGEHAEAAVRRLDEIEHVGDIGVISAYDPETEEIAAFEELIGAHGGLGGSQTKPFLVHPAEWEFDLAPLLGAPMVSSSVGRDAEQCEEPRTEDHEQAHEDEEPGEGGEEEPGERHACRTGSARGHRREW